MTLPKTDLVNTLYNQLELPKTKSTQVVESLIEIIKKTLENGEDVLISGFGKFCVKGKRERRGRLSSKIFCLVPAFSSATFHCSFILHICPTFETHSMGFW